MRVVGEDRLTAADLALHELMVATAYEVDPILAQDLYLLPVSSALHFLGPHARKDSLGKSLDRLRSTTVCFDTPTSGQDRMFGETPLLLAWHETVDGRENIAFQLPFPIRRLMVSPERYAYLELAPLASMTTRAGIRLYRNLAARAAGMVWSLVGDNAMIVEVTPEDLARWLDVKSNEAGRLGRFLKPAMRDLRHVRTFKTEMLDPEIDRGGRGRPRVTKFRFRITKTPPSHHILRQPWLSRDEMSAAAGGDDQRFRTSPTIWWKAWTLSKESVEKADTPEYHAAIRRMPDILSSAWLIALDEALSGVAVTDGFETRKLRGQSLLDRIDQVGADQTAWEFVIEEMTEGDDLIALIQTSAPDAKTARAEAQRSRYHRLKDSRGPRPITRRAPLSMREDSEPEAEDRILVEETPPPAKPSPYADKISEFSRKHGYYLVYTESIAAATRLIHLRWSDSSEASLPLRGAYLVLPDGKLGDLEYSRAVDEEWLEQHVEKTPGLIRYEFYPGESDKEVLDRWAGEDVLKRQIEPALTERDIAIHRGEIVPD